LGGPGVNVQRGIRGDEGKRARDFFFDRFGVLVLRVREGVSKFGDLDPSHVLNCFVGILNLSALVETSLPVLKPIDGTFLLAVAVLVQRAFPDLVS
jgi:hypothetical protein